MNIVKSIGYNFIEWQKNNPEKELMRIEKIRNAHKGKKFSDAHRKNLSEAKKKLFREGKLNYLVNNWNKGKTKYEDERLQKISELRKKERADLRLKAWQEKYRKNYRQTHHYSSKL